MRVITLARKPLVGSVAENVLRHSTGGLNIDASRVRGAKGAGVWGSSNQTCQTNPGLHTERRVFNASPEGDDYRSQQHEGGRWPTNVILHHRPECVCVGEKRVPTSVNHHHSKTSLGGTGAYGGGVEREGTDYADADGLEVVEAWECDECCPVAALDDQDDTSRFYKQTQDES